jgi:hypothetical protein
LICKWLVMKCSRWFDASLKEKARDISEENDTLGRDHEGVRAEEKFKHKYFYWQR